MDICGKETKIFSTEKRSGNLYKASSILSLVAFLLTTALFVRTEMLDSKFSLEIQQMKDALKAEQLLTNKPMHVEKDFDVISGE